MIRLVTEAELIAPGYPRSIEDDQLPNDFMSGHALAAHLAQVLEDEGYADVAITPEDYGWHLSGRSPEGHLMCHVVLSSLALPQTPREAATMLRVSVAPVARSTGMLIWKRDVSGGVEAHSRRVFGVLRDCAGVTVLEEQTRLI